MNSEEIKQLLEKYYEGESLLRRRTFAEKFLQHGKYPPDLMDEKEIFRYYMQSAEIPEPSLTFEKR